MIGPASRPTAPPPLPSCRVAPVSISVVPVKVLTPVSVSVPAPMVSPPVPEMKPENRSEALVSVSVLAPRITWPDPERLTTSTPPLAPEMLKVPLTSGSAESAIEPPPTRFSVAPRSMVVRPV